MVMPAEQFILIVKIKTVLRTDYSRVERKTMKKDYDEVEQKMLYNSQRETKRSECCINTVWQGNRKRE